jgi:transposase InsO family protein
MCTSQYVSQTLPTLPLLYSRLQTDVRVIPRLRQKNVQRAGSMGRPGAFQVGFEAGGGKRCRRLTQRSKRVNGEGIEPSLVTQLEP